MSVENPPFGRVITMNGVRLHSVAGTGNVVILLHGNAHSANLFLDLTLSIIQRS
jgi:hypothetical protein